MHTDITLILDRSSSMRGIQHSTIDGFNQFLRHHQKRPDPASLTLIQFDATVAVTCEATSIGDAPSLSEESYRLGRGTALLDALGVAVETTRRRLDALLDDASSRAVLIAVLTDGEENHSRAFTWPQANAMIKHYTEMHRWQFGLVAANQDSVRTSALLGMQPRSSLDFMADPESTKKAFASLSDSLDRFREQRGRDRWQLDHSSSFDC